MVEAFRRSLFDVQLVDASLIDLSGEQTEWEELPLEG